MPRARSPDRQRAFDLWIESKGQRELKDIAAELGVSPEQVRKWKHADAWDSKTVKVTLPNGKGNVTKRKKGGQPGNKNAAGNSGGAPPGNKNNFRHGAYERVMGELLEADEAEIFSDDGTGLDVEAELRQTLAALNAKEVRLVKRINQIKEAAAKSKSNMISIGATKSVVKREVGAFEIDEKGQWGKKIQSPSADSKDYATGERQSATSSHTISVFDALNKLEAELDKVQGRKIKVLGDLEKIRIDRERLALERKRLDGQTEQSKLAKAWIAALTGEGLEDEEDAADETD